MSAIPPDQSETTPATPRGHRRRVSITFTLATSIGVLVSLAVCAELLLGMSAGRRNTLSLLNDKSIFLMDSIEAGIRHHLDPAENIVVNFQRLVDSGMLDPTDRNRVGDILSGMVVAESQVYGVGFWDTELNQTVAFRPDDQTINILRQENNDSPEFVGVLQEVKNATGPIWRELAFDNNTTLINVVHPVHRDGVLIGFSGAVVTMPALSQLIADLGDRFSATGFILYGPDHVLAHPNLVSPHPDLSADTPVVQRGRVGDMVLGNLHNRRIESDFEAAATEGVQVATVDTYDATQVVFTRQIQNYGTVPWTIGVHATAGSLGEEFRRLIAAAIAGVGVLIVSVLAAIILGRHIAKPIKRSAEGAVQVAALDFEHARHLPPSRIRELNDQSEAFNAMLNGLRWFETYVPKTLVRRLIQRSEPMQSEQREITIMFTDIIGFTSLSEVLPAEDVARLLNRHFELLGKCVEEEHGTIDKFIGDSVMAFWGAPDPQADHAEKAIRAASAIVEALEIENKRRSETGRAPVRVRIGLHTGSAIIGNIGGPGRINYTIVGDTVNTAQRIETLAKEFDTGVAATVLISEATATAAGGAHAKATSAGEFTVKGRSEPVRVFRLAEVSSPPDDNDSRQNRVERD